MIFNKKNKLQWMIYLLKNDMNTKIKRLNKDTKIAKESISKTKYNIFQKELKNNICELEKIVNNCKKIPMKIQICANHIFL